MKLYSFILFSSLLILIACKENTYDPLPEDNSREYWPDLKLGQEFIYKADSIKYGFIGSSKDGDSVSYFIKEVVERILKDSTKTVYTIATYNSVDSTNWNFVKNYFYEDEKSRINRKHNNEIKTLLIFPVIKYFYWNGNQFNSKPAQEFSYSNTNFTFNFETLYYPNSLKVSMDSSVNAIRYDIDYEIFTKNIGSVYKESSHLNIENNDSLDSFGNVILKRPPLIIKGTVFKQGLVRFK